MVKIQSAVAHLQTNLKLPVRTAMATLGLLTSSIPAVQWARLHSRPLQMEILQKWSHLEPLEKPIKISARVKRALWWWRNPANLTKGLGWSFPLNKRLTTDASAWGWGAHLDSQTVQGTWSKAEARKSSNWRELKAIALALVSFHQNIRDQLVQVLSDNMTAIA